MSKNTKPKSPLGKGKIGFKTSNVYKVSAKKLWEAVTKAKHVNRYFVDKMKEDFDSKLKVNEWYWKEYGHHPIWPTKYEKEKKLEFQWENHKKKYRTTVTFSMKKIGKLVELEIHERGWKQADLKNAFDNCQGWTLFLAYLKGYLHEDVILQTRVK